MRNPFNFESVATTAHVSAAGSLIYYDFLQTPPIDADGLVMTGPRGDVVGWLPSRPGDGSIPIGSAIPINAVKVAFERIKLGRQETGKSVELQRSVLGLEIQEITPQLADSLRIEQKTGALVVSVQNDSPAETAGIGRGDVIVEYDHRLIKDERELPAMVRNTAPGHTVSVKVVRGHEVRDLLVTLESEQPETAITYARNGNDIVCRDAPSATASCCGVQGGDYSVMTEIDSNCLSRQPSPWCPERLKALVNQK